MFNPIISFIFSIFPRKKKKSELKKVGKKFCRKVAACHAGTESMAAPQLALSQFYSHKQNQDIGKFHGVQTRRSTDYEASKLSKGRSGPIMPWK